MIIYYYKFVRGLELVEPWLFLRRKRKKRRWYIFYYNTLK